MQRAFEPADCDGVTLIFACAPPGINAQVAQAAEARGVWVCRADSGQGVRLPGVIARGPLRVAISTGGQAPAAARAIRAALGPKVPAVWGELVRIVAEQRVRWRGRPDRAARLKALIQGPLAPVLHSDRAPDPDALNDWLQSS